MKRANQWTKTLLRFEVLLKWTVYLSGLLTLVGIIATAAKGVDLGRLEPIAAFLREYFFHFWLGAVTALAIVLLIWTMSLHRRFTSGFRDNFKRSLAANWDFVGDWRITEAGELLITNSDPGGLTKIGAYWENYTLEFDAHILNDCLGVIVRAQDLNNYYMFQIRKNRIRPHRRVTFPIVEAGDEESKDRSEADSQAPHPVKFAVGWDIPNKLAVDLDPPISDWFSTTIIVRGEAVSIKINAKQVFYAESFLKISTGKIGFRNSGHEKAFVRDVKVTLHS